MDSRVERGLEFFVRARRRRDHRSGPRRRGIRAQGPRVRGSRHRAALRRAHGSDRPPHRHLALAILTNDERLLLWTFQRRPDKLSYGMSKGVKKTDILQGTLDLMVLQTLDALGPLHGYGIARRIEQVSESVLELNEGTVYTALMRLQQQGWIAAEWGASENNRRAKFYSITKNGRKQLAREAED